MRIGIFGTGLMGAPMALRLIEVGHTVAAYNRTPGKLDAIAAAGGQIFANPVEVLQTTDIVILMLTDQAAIEAVLLTSDCLAEIAGKTVIQMGTIAPQESRELATRITTAGGTYLEATVLGSIPQVKTGTLIVMVGCEQESQCEQFVPLLQAFGPQPLYVGKVGTAAALKLAMNQLIGALTTAFALSLQFVQREGLEVNLFMDVLRESALYAPTFDKKLSRMVEQNFANPNFPTKHLLKDMELFQAAARDYQTDLVQGVINVVKEAIAAGHADDDYSSLYTAIYLES